MVSHLNQYSMQETSSVAAQGAKHIETFLAQFPHTVAIINVEQDPRYQTLDIDFLWVTKIPTLSTQCYSLELKVDRYKSGNFFFETVSNVTRQTPGCFLYTEADYLLYYFIHLQTLYILPTLTVREWFLANETQFEEKRLETRTTSGRVLYQSLGKIVPIRVLLNALGNQIQVHQLSIQISESPPPLRRKP